MSTANMSLSLPVVDHSAGTEVTGPDRAPKVLNDAFILVDAHDHTTGKGVQIATGGIADGAVTAAKLAAGATTPTNADRQVARDAMFAKLASISKLGAVLDTDMFGTEAVLGWTSFAGAASSDGSRVGGMRKMATAAAGSAQTTYLYGPSGADGLAFDVAPRSTATMAWGLSFRAKFTGVVEAGTYAAVGFGGGGAVDVGIGVFGDGSTTKWCVQKAGGTYAALSSDSNIDTTAFHQFDLVFDKTSLYARIDGGAWRTISSASLVDTYAFLLRDMKNGATASARTFEIDWIVFVTERVA